MSNCPVNCSENPDSVEKINWKCVECQRDLREDFERVVSEKKRVQAERKKVKTNIGLSEEEIEKRRVLKDE